MARKGIARSKASWQMTGMGKEYTAEPHPRRPIQYYVVRGSTIVSILMLRLSINGFGLGRA